MLPVVEGGVLDNQRSESIRQHNENHQVSISIGKPFKSRVIGAVGPVGRDYGALAINSANGNGGALIDESITSGKVVTAALV